MPPVRAMVSVLEKAYAAARAAMEKSYDGRCTVIAYREEADEAGLARTVEETVAEDVPCRLSYESVQAARPDGCGAATVQTVRLFTAPASPIPEGAKVIVTQSGRRETYFACGTPAVYHTHAESMLLLARRYA